MIRKSGYRFSEQIMLHLWPMERNEFTLDELHSGMMLRDSSRSQPFFEETCFVG